MSQIALYAKEPHPCAIRGGITPLFLAVQLRSVDSDVVAALIENGAYVTQRIVSTANRVFEDQRTWFQNGEMTADEFMDAVEVNTIIARAPRRELDPRMQVNTSLCSLSGATAADVQRLVDQGGDANGLCNSNRSRPLHVALLPGARASSAVIQALITAGGDVLVENRNGDTPASLSEERLEEAISQFQREEITLAEFNDRQAINNAINRAIEALSAAYQNLCNVAWWRSASASSMSSISLWRKSGFRDRQDGPYVLHSHVWRWVRPVTTGLSNRCGCRRAICLEARGIRSTNV